MATSYVRLTDAAIRAATLPRGKSQHYLHDTEQPGQAIEDELELKRQEIELLEIPLSPSRLFELTRKARNT